MYEFLLILSVLVLVTVAVFYWRQPSCSVFHPVTFYLAFHGLLFVFRPILAHLGEFSLIYQVYGFTPSPADKASVLIAANLGLIAFVGAALAVGNTPMRFAQGKADLTHRAALESPLLLTIAVCVPIGLISLIAHWNERATDTYTMVIDAATGRTVNTIGVGYFAEAQLMLVPCVVLFAWVFRFRWWALLPLVAFIVARAGTGGRGPFVVAALGAALAYAYDRKWRWPTPRSLVLLAGVLALFNVVGEDRGRAVRSLFGEEASANRDHGIAGLKFMEGMDFANLEYFEYLVHVVPQRTGTHEYFLDNLQILTEPVPRVLWPGKPVGPPIPMFSLFDYGTPVGMTRSLPGEGWVQLGYPGVIIWCGLFGMGMGWIYRRFASGRQGNFAVAGYVIFMSMSVIFLRDGELITVFRTGLFYFAPVLLWLMFARLLGVPPFAALCAPAGSRRARSRLPAAPVSRRRSAIGGPASPQARRLPRRGAAPSE